MHIVNAHAVPMSIHMPTDTSTDMSVHMSLQCLYTSHKRLQARMHAQQKDKFVKVKTMETLCVVNAGDGTAKREESG